MPPKSGKGSAAKSKSKEEQREDTLQAVVSPPQEYFAFHPSNRVEVLADSYERRFTPFTLERPRVCNTTGLHGNCRNRDAHTSR